MFPTKPGALTVALHRLGVKPGDAVILHAAYRKVRPVAGGPAGLLQGVADAVGPDGLLVMPAFTLENTDPDLWRDPPPAPEREPLRAAMRPWRPDLPPSRIGAVAEAFLEFPGVARSEHPVLSFCAWGSGAADAVAKQRVDDPYGSGSPLDALLARDAWVLLLGVDHRADTFIHRAEQLAGIPARWPYRYPVHAPGGGVAWEEGHWYAGCSEGFDAVAPLLKPVTRKGRVGKGRASLVRARDVVAAARELLAVDPGALRCRDRGCPGCARGA